MTLHICGLKTFMKALGGNMQKDILVTEHGDIALITPTTKKGGHWVSNNIMPTERFKYSRVVSTGAQFVYAREAIDAGLTVDFDI